MSARSLIPEGWFYGDLLMAEITDDDRDVLAQFDRNRAKRNEGDQ